MSNTGGEADATGARGYGSIGGSFGINMPGLDQTTAQLGKLTAALSNLQTTMNKIQSSSAGFTQAVNNITKSLSSASTTAPGTTSGGTSSGGLAQSLFGSTDNLARSIALFPANFIQNQVQNDGIVVYAGGGGLGLHLVLDEVGQEQGDAAPGCRWAEQLCASPR